MITKQDNKKSESYIEAVLDHIHNDVMSNANGEPEEVRREMQQALVWLTTLETGARSISLDILYWFYKNWDSFSLEFRREYNYMFDVFAQEVAGKSPRTVKDYIRAGDTFIDKGIKPSFRVPVLRRDLFGKPVQDESGEDIYDLKEWDRTKVNVTKLSIVRSVAENGKMTDELWGMLMDPHVTDEQVKQEVWNPGGTGDTGSTTTNPQMKFHMDGPILTVTQYGNEYEIAEVYFHEYEDNPTVRDAIDKLMRLLHITPDDEIIASMTSRFVVDGQYKERKDE